MENTITSDAEQKEKERERERSSSAARSAARSMIFRPRTDELAPRAVYVPYTEVRSWSRDERARKRKREEKEKARSLPR